MIQIIQIFWSASSLLVKPEMGQINERHTNPGDTGCDSVPMAFIECYTINVVAHFDTHRREADADDAFLFHE